MIMRPSGSGFVGEGWIANANVEVKPMGLYAQVDAVFTLNVPATAYTGADFEAVLYFNLPPGSFIHDSWLWLDSTNIISAEMVERNQGISTYEGIVRRSRDPSLLIHTLANSYRLNVFPITKTYPRKIKLIYSTPFIWREGRADVPLPVSIFQGSAPAPDFSLHVWHTASHADPMLREVNAAPLVTGSTPVATAVTVPAVASGMPGSNLTLSYTAPAAAWMRAYSQDSVEGVYHLFLPQTDTIKSRTLILALERPLSGDFDVVHKWAYLKEALRRAALAELRPGDSLNLYYVSGITVQPVFPSPQPATDSIVSAALAAVPATITSSPYVLGPLLRAACAAAQAAGPGGRTLLVAGSDAYPTAAVVDTFLLGLQSAIGGFTRRVDIINNSRSSGNNALYSALGSASGGTSIPVTGAYYDEYTRHTVYESDVAAVFTDLMRDASEGTLAYTVTLPAAGILYGAYPVAGAAYSPAKPYTAVGRYYGTLTAPGSATLQYVSDSGIKSVSYLIDTVRLATAHAMQCWTSRYLSDLVGGSSAAQAEAIDSSIRQRVLCPLTALLALETGDTINTPQSILSPPIWTDGFNLVNPRVNTGLVASPNPFTTSVRFTGATGIRLLEVFNVMGQRVYIRASTGTEESLDWSGVSSEGIAVPAGVYVVRLSGANGTLTLKVQKL